VLVTGHAEHARLLAPEFVSLARPRLSASRKATPSSRAAPVPPVAVAAAPRAVAADAPPASPPASADGEDARNGNAHPGDEQNPVEGAMLLRMLRDDPEPTEPPAPGEPPPDSHAPRQPAVVFRIGDQRFALPLTAVVQVLEWRAIRRIPHHHDPALLGLVNVGGELHLCMSLDVVLGSSGHPSVQRTPSSRLLALGERVVEWTVPVEETLGIAQVAFDSLAAAADAGVHPAAGFVRGSFEYRGSRIGLLDPDRLGAELRRRLA
jgi:chemotaxis-related protein WspD